MLRQIRTSGVRTKRGIHGRQEALRRANATEAKVLQDGVVVPRGSVRTRAVVREERERAGLVDTNSGLASVLKVHILWRIDRILFDTGTLVLRRGEP